MIHHKKLQFDFQSIPISIEINLFQHSKKHNEYEKKKKRIKH